jgi:uncharacterized protein with HEPN domain
VRPALPSSAATPLRAFLDAGCSSKVGVDLDLVWNVVETKIPPLRAAVRRLLDDPELT